MIKCFYVLFQTRCLYFTFLFVFDVLILQHTGLYPIVSKGMRLIAQGRDPLEGQRHMCGMGNLFHYHSTGFPELDELMKTPQPLIFIMELLQVRSSGNVTLDIESRRQSFNFYSKQLFLALCVGGQEKIHLFILLSCTFDTHTSDRNDKTQVLFCLKHSALKQYYPA